MKKQKFLVQLTPIFQVRPVKGSKGRRYFAFKTKTHHVRFDRIKILVVETARDSFEIYKGTYSEEAAMKNSYIYESNIPITDASADLLKKQITAHFNLPILLPDQLNASK